MVDPVPYSLIGSILQGLVPTVNRYDLCSQHLHFLYIGSLTLHIQGPHIDDALHTGQRTYGSRGNSMLPRSCFCYYPFFMELPCQQDLSNGIVYFMRPGMVQVFSLKKDLCSKIIRQTLGSEQRGGPACIIPQ